ncbi:hypothetical protein [Acinetobacter haemolyticus]|uniref:hypothetical protein n=1 Tax=Acinetobacter haemolyticus TaxID=29430 RepID=UPI001D1948E1|nr:hypothetical protein [Acinetobacter haemolyticus]
MLKLKQVFAIGIVTFIPFAAYAAPAFKAPFACGQTWSYSTYPGHNYNALDFVRWDNGGHQEQLCLLLLVELYR